MGRVKTIVSILLLYMALSGCRQNDGGIGNVVVDDHLFKEVELENARFELKPSAFSQPLQPSVDFWLKKDDQVALKWDSFEFHWERTGTMCVFESNTSTANCSICNYCQNPVVQNGPPCFGIELGTNVTRFDLVVMHDGFVLVPEPKLALSVPSPQMVNGCRPDSPDPISFQPERSAAYQMIIPKTDLSLAYSPFDIVTETKIHVVEAGMNQTVAYQLMRQSIDGTNYWTWAITGENSWLENFSPNLRVTDIRVLRGGCADGSAQGKQCATPNESVPVRPSRIFFLPNFQGAVSGYLGVDLHSCYSDPNASDGKFVNLGSCRNTSNAAPTERFTTPTYEFLPERLTEKLTWLVEFDPNGGGDADLTTSVPDPMPPDAVLIIEFTIHARGENYEAVKTNMRAVYSADCVADAGRLQ